MRNSNQLLFKFYKNLNFTKYANILKQIHTNVFQRMKFKKKLNFIT